MIWYSALPPTVATGVLLSLCAWSQERVIVAGGSYYTAFCAPGEGSGVRNLVVFPSLRKAVRINLPFDLGRLAYSPDGRSIYGAPMQIQSEQALYKIEFNPIRATAMATNVSLKQIHSIAPAVHLDQLLVSGGYVDGGNRYCGVFRVTLPGGAVTPVIQSADCRYRSAWVSLSLSPDGTQAVAIHNQRLELIDIAGRTAKSLGEGFLKASWSPDGKWIAAIENGGKWRTVLFDAARLTRTRVLGPSEAQWSPDSRYLLSVSGRGCSSETGTIYTLDVQSGAKVKIESSKCQVYVTSTGWVSSEIIP